MSRFIHLGKCLCSPRSFIFRSVLLFQEQKKVAEGQALSDAANQVNWRENL